MHRAIRHAGYRYALWGAFCLIGSAFGPAAWGAGYDYVTIQVGGGLSTQATGINAAGIVVGSYQQPQGRSVLIRSFTYKDGAYTTFKSIEPVSGAGKTTLAVAGAVLTRAYALNDFDLVAGTYDHDPNQLGILTTSAYLRNERDGYTTFDMPGSAGLTIAWGVNKAKVTVGVYFDPASVYHGFIRAADGCFTTLDFPGSPYTQLMGINDQGDIVGFYQDPADYILKGFLYRAGQFQAVAPADAACGSYTYRITNDGRIVGWYINGNGNVLSFLATPAANA